MERVLVRVANSLEQQQMLDWLRDTRDGELFDHNVLDHESTFVLSAFRQSGRIAYLPVQQPLMMENLIFCPGLTERETALAIRHLADHTIEEAYRRGAGEVYFLCRDASTCQFAERHGFRDIAALGLKTYRLNLKETFGC